MIYNTCICVSDNDGRVCMQAKIINSRGEKMNEKKKLIILFKYYNIIYGRKKKQSMYKGQSSSMFSNVEPV